MSYIKVFPRSRVQGKYPISLSYGMILLLSGVWMFSLLVSLCESWLIALLQLITNVAEHPQARMKLQRGIEVLRAMVKAFASAMIKKFLQANNSAASVPIPTIPKSQGCDIGQEPNYGFLNR
jgi:hypothetical protein